MASTPGAAAALDEQVEGEGALEQRGRGLAHGGDERPLDLHAGGGAAGVDDAGDGVAALPGPGQLAAGVVDVEDGAEGDQLVDPVGALVDEHPHGVDVAQAVAGGEGVGEVEVGGVGVGAAEHGGHAALGPPGGGHVEGGLGEHADAHAAAGGPHRGRQAGDARAEDEQVERFAGSWARAQAF